MMFWNDFCAVIPSLSYGLLILGQHNIEPASSVWELVSASLLPVCIGQLIIALYLEGV